MGLAEILLEHQDRAVVRVGDVFIKVETDIDKAMREREVLGIAPVPVPEVLWWMLGHPSLLALARVTGAALSGSTSSDDWRAAGQVVRRLHEEPTPEWQSWLRPGVVRHWLDDDRDWLLAHALLDPHVVEAAHAIAADVLTQRSVDPVLTHRDLQAEHVFVDGGEVTAIIDWGDAGLGDGLYDVATLTIRHRDRLDDVLDGYGEVDRAVIRAWWAERFLGEPRWLVEHGFDPAESLAGLRSLV